MMTLGRMAWSRFLVALIVLATTVSCSFEPPRMAQARVLHVVRAKGLPHHRALFSYEGRVMAVGIDEDLPQTSLLASDPGTGVFSRVASWPLVESGPSALFDSWVGFPGDSAVAVVVARDWDASLVLLGGGNAAQLLWKGQATWPVKADARDGAIVLKTATELLRFTSRGLVDRVNVGSDALDVALLPTGAAAVLHNGGSVAVLSWDGAQARISRPSWWDSHYSRRLDLISAGDQLFCRIVLPSAGTDSGAGVLGLRWDATRRTVDPWAKARLPAWAGIEMVSWNGVLLVWNRDLGRGLIVEENALDDRALWRELRVGGCPCELVAGQGSDRVLHVLSSAGDLMAIEVRR